MKHILLSIILTLFVIGITAQRNMELLTVAGTYGLASNYETPYENDQAKPAGLLVNLKAPIPFSESTAWFTQLTYTTFHINNDIQMPADIANPIHLHSFILQTGISKKFGDNLDKGVIILFAPRYMTDFQNASGKNFQFGGVFMYHRQFHEGLMMRFGGLYHQELGGPYIVPIVETDWQINSKWSLVGQ